MHQEQSQYQVLYRFDDDTTWRAEDGRALVGQLTRNETSSAILALFHHQPDGGGALGLPTIRFRGGRGFFGIVALGDPAIEALQSVDHVIRRRLSEHLGRPIRAELSDTHCSIAIGERMRRYRAHMVVFARKHRAMKTLFEAPDDQLAMYLRRMAIRDLRTQADALALEIPAEHFPFQIVDVGRRARIPLNKQGQRLYAGAVTHIDILTTLDFKGHWAIGGLLNRGFGGVRRVLPKLVTTAALPAVSGDSYAQL